MVYGKMLNDDIMFLDKIEGLALIGQGNTAEIFDYNKDSILKLFRDGFPEQGVTKEWTVSKRIQEVYDMMPRALKYVVYVASIHCESKSLICCLRKTDCVILISTRGISW